MGGVDRSYVDQSSRLGLHRFTRREPDPSAARYTGEDLDKVQKIVAHLLGFAEEMGVDPRVVRLAGEAGSSGMRWITVEEAGALKVTYQPRRWTTWKLVASNGGAIGLSTTEDGKASMQLICTPSDGPYLVLWDEEADASWFRQCAQGQAATHPVLGSRVDSKRVEVKTMDAGRGSALFFFLDRNRIPPFTSASLFQDFGAYPTACIDHNGRYAGSIKGLKDVGSVALKNCIR
jgi:hypothetical protein